MKYLKLFELYKSTNPIIWMDRDSITDIMTELTDSYYYSNDYMIIDTKEIVAKVMERRLVLVSYKFEIPNDKLENFKKSLELVEWRFHQMLGLV